MTKLNVLKAAYAACVTCSSSYNDLLSLLGVDPLFEIAWRARTGWSTHKVHQLLRQLVQQGRLAIESAALFLGQTPAGDVQVSHLDFSQKHRELPCWNAASCHCCQT